MAHIAYYLSPVSPWTYLGHARFAEMAKRAGATVEVMPVDYGVIFPQSGGLPLGKRAPQRQAYRLQELARWQAFLGLPLVIQPKFFPVDGTHAAQLISGAPEAVRLALAYDLLQGVWAREENISDAAVLATIAARHGITDAPATIAAGKSVYEQNTQRAVAAQVFGAPSYVLGEQIFWGQDRLDFLERALAA